jgi:hypothetical protein
LSFSEVLHKLNQGSPERKFRASFEFRVCQLDTCLPELKADSHRDSYIYGLLTVLSGSSGSSNLMNRGMIFLMPLLRLHTSLHLQEEERPVKINYSIIGKKRSIGSTTSKKQRIKANTN